MAVRDVPRAIARGGVQQCPTYRLLQIRRKCAPGVSDRLAPMRCATWPGARRRSLQDAEISFGGEVSLMDLPLGSHHSITSSARASSFGGRVRPSVLAVLRLINR